MPRDRDAIGWHSYAPPSDGSIEIRPATIGDATGIGVVNTLTWQVAYRGHFPQDFLDALDAERSAENWERHLVTGSPDREKVLVAEAAQSIVGFTSVGPARNAREKDEAEVRTLYVLPPWWRRGVGGSLLAAAEETMTGFGFERAILWVLESNERARRFYEAAGWSSDGACKRDERWGFPIDEVRYTRALR